MEWRFLPICSQLGLKVVGLCAAMALQQLLRSSLTSDRLGKENLFEEEDPWAEHRALLQGMLVKFPQASKPELRQELGELWHFHKQTKAPRDWGTQRSTLLRRLVSKVLRTSRQCKTTERLTPSMAALVKVVTCGLPKKRLLKKTSSAPSPKRSPAKQEKVVEVPQAASASAASSQPSAGSHGEGPSRAQILALYKATPTMLIEDSDTSEDASVVVCAPAAEPEQEPKQTLPEGKTYFDAARGKAVHCCRSGQLLEAISMQPGPMGFLLCTFKGFAPIQSEVPNLRLVVKRRPATASNELQESEADEEGSGEEETAEDDEDEEAEEDQEEGEEEEEKEEEQEEGEEEEEKEEEEEEEEEEEQEEQGEQGEQEDEEEEEAQEEEEAEQEDQKKQASYSVLYYKASCSIGIRRKFGNKAQCFSFGGKRCGKNEEELRRLGEACLARLAAGETEDHVKAWAKQQCT